MGYAPGTGTGFVSVGQYLDANRDTLARERSEIGQGVDQQIQAAQSAADTVQPAQHILGDFLGNSDWSTAPGYGDALAKTTAANDQIAALGTQGGVADYFKQHMGDTQSQANFDSGLFGGGIHRDPFDLNAYLDAHHTLANPPAPATPEHDREPIPPGSFPGTQPGPASNPPLTRPHDRR